MSIPQAVGFVYSDWVAEFPEFVNVPQPLAQSYFNRASNIFSNTTANGAYGNDGSQLLALLYLLTSHIAWLNAPRDPNGLPAGTGTPAPPIVGRINSASEGSVSVGADMGDANAGSPSQAWYISTRYGAEFWQATGTFRSGGYVANPMRIPFVGGRFRIY